MADYTKLSKQDIEALMREFVEDDIVSSKAMPGGAANSSFLVRTDVNTFILSVCNEKNFDQAQNLANLLHYLGRRCFPTTKIISSKCGERVTSYNGIPVILKEYLSGGVCGNPTSQMLFKLGTLIAQLHQISAPDYLPKRFPYGIESFSQVISAFPESEYAKWLKEKQDFIQSGFLPELPTGLIHGDIFLDNVLFNEGNLVAIIDFEEACNYYKVFDLGMCIVGTCVENGSVSLDKAKNLLVGYESIRELGDMERNVLPLFSEYGAVATSFWRFRHNFIINPQSRKDNYLEMVTVANDIHKNSSNFRSLYL